MFIQEDALVPLTSIVDSGERGESLSEQESVLAVYAVTVLPYSGIIL